MRSDASASLQRFLVAIAATLLCSGAAATRPIPDGETPTGRFPDESIRAQAADTIISYVGSTLWNGASDVAVVGNYAYYVLPYGLLILDVSDPSVPAVVSQTYMPGTARAVAVNGGLAYVVLFNVGLQIVNVADPVHPVLLGCHKSPSHVYGVAVAANYAYLATQSSGLQIIDVADPASPVLVGSTTNPSGGYGVTLVGKYAYVPDGRTDLQIVDVSDPSSPVWVATYDNPNFGIGGIATAGTYAYVAAGVAGLMILDVADPAAPVLEGSLSVPGYAYDVAVVGNYAYVADIDSGLQIVEVLNPHSPILAGSIENASRAMAVAVVGNHAYVTDQKFGLRIIDVAIPAIPTLTGAYITIPDVHDVSVVGHVACVLAQPPALATVDVTDPTVPSAVGCVALGGGYATSLDAAGNYAYAVTDGAILKIVNIANPAAPVLTGEYSTQPKITDLDVAGGYAYLTNGNLEIVSIADPAHPTLVATFHPPSRAWAVAVVGDIAYVADAAAGLLAVDVSDPLAPELLGSVSVPYLATHVAISGDYAYMLSYWGTWVLSSDMTIVNVADPAAPFVVGLYSEYNAQFIDVQVAGDYAYVTNGTGGGMRIINVSSPESPVLAGTYGPSGSPIAVALVGSYLYVTDYAGLQILYVPVPTGVNDEPHVPTDFELEANYPNPFNASTAIRFALAAPSPVKLQVWNVLGQRITTLIDATLPAGRHAVVWDGESDSGADAASGVYFYMLTAGDQVKTRKMLLLK